MSVRVAIPDLVSPSYFPAIAAVELGFLPDATIELLYPVTKTYEELREGRLDFVGGAAHAALYAFKDWHGAHTLCGLAPGCCARWRSTCTGSWSCATTWSRSAAT